MDLHQIHPSHIRWELPYSTLHDPAFFHSKIAKNSEKTQKILTDLGYSICVENLTDELLGQFVLLYNQFLEQKPRGTIFPIKERIEEGKKNGIVYTILSFYNIKKNLIGGIIVSENRETNFITTNYKVLPHELPERKRFPESIAYVFTYLFYRIAFEKKITHISHGRDRNPYGFYSNIGLGLFKMRSGVKPYVAKQEKVTFSDKVQYVSGEDMLVWLGDTPGTPITKAILITKLTPEEAKEKYKPLFLLHDVHVDIWDHATYTNLLHTNK